MKQTNKIFSCLDTLEKYLKRKKYKTKQMQKWRKEHPEYKEKVKLYLQKKRQKTPWLFHYQYALRRCTDTKHKIYKYYGGKGIQMFLTEDEIKILYLRDKAKNMKYPSIDRIDGTGHYCFSNCRFIEMSENRKNRMKKPIKHNINVWDWFQK